MFFELDLVLKKQFSESLALLLNLVALLAKLCNQGRVGISIDLRLVLNFTSPACIVKSVHGLVDVASGWRHASNHRGARIAAQRVLQDTGELGVAVWNEVVLLSLFA